MSPARGNHDALRTLERLLEIPVADLKQTLSRATDLVAEALNADKVDAFVLEPERSTLFAVGTSDQPLSALERRQGLDRLPLANGGRIVETFVTGRTHTSGRLEEDPEELRGIKEVLAIRSSISVPLVVGGERRGVLVITSQSPQFFDESDVRFAETVARWVGIIAHHAELVQSMTASVAAESRRAVAEELLLVMAHDLRNQLAPITWRLTTVRERAVLDRRDADTRELDSCLKGMARLGALIAEMLDVARIDQGVFTLDLRRLDLALLVRETSANFSTTANPIDCQAESGVTVLADQARIRQCLENLISNAVKHSPPGSPVVTKVSLEPHESGNRACVTVADNGPGISPELLPHVFERFTKGTPRRDGLGLGLYLAHRIADSHGGELIVESQLGQGACFKLCLPHGERVP